MTQKVIHIPTINDKQDDFVKLFDIWSQANGYSSDVKFDFSDCNFLRPNAVAFLGGVAKLIMSRSGSVEFDWESLRSHVMVNLCQNGFAGNFGFPSSTWTGHSIHYREDMTLNMNSIMDYLTDYWLGRGWVHVTDRLRDAIVGRMWEIYINAFEHSESEIGVFSCGQHFKVHNELILSVVDFGQGIPARVRSFLRSHIPEELVGQLTGASCLRWAFKAGNSTSADDLRRGLGLDLLKEFVKINQGRLEIYSNDGYVLIDKDGERYQNWKYPFEGTAVHITLRCDEKLYCFRDEI